MLDDHQPSPVLWPAAALDAAAAAAASSGGPGLALIERGEAVGRAAAPEGGGDGAKGALSPPPNAASLPATLRLPPQDPGGGGLPPHRTVRPAPRALYPCTSQRRDSRSRPRAVGATRAGKCSTSGPRRPPTRGLRLGRPPRRKSWSRPLPSTSCRARRGASPLMPLLSRAPAEERPHARLAPQGWSDGVAHSDVEVWEEVPEVVAPEVEGEGSTADLEVPAECDSE